MLALHLSGDEMTVLLHRSTTETHEFPEPTMSRSEMMDYFSTHFGFTEDEVNMIEI